MYFARSMGRMTLVRGIVGGGSGCLDIRLFTGAGSDRGG